MIPYLPPAPAVVEIDLAEVTEVTVMSFGFRNGKPLAYPIVDCTRLVNPHGNPALREGTGLDGAVRTEVLSHSPVLVESLLTEAKAKFDQAGRVAFACVGGRHRSVVMAEEFCRRAGLQKPYHRDLPSASSPLPLR